MGEAAKFREDRGEIVKDERRRQLLSDFAERWASINRGRFEPSTRMRYVTCLAHASEALEHIYVDALEPSDFRKWVADKLGEGYSSATVASWLRVIRLVLDDAVSDGLLPGNSAKAITGLTPGRTQGKRGNTLTPDEFRRFLAHVPTCGLAPDIARMLLVAAWTRCRKGELLALQFDDYKDGELRIERSVWRRHVKATKTDDPRRVVVVEPLAQVLNEQRRWLLESQHPALSTGLMFPARPKQGKAGRTRRGVDEVSWFRSETVLDAPLRKVVKAAGITPISPHSLRRTYENLLRKAGVDDLVRRSMAGWRSEEAQRIYATVDPEERQAAARVLVALVQEAS
jgi:integrase